jgi:hypothetical protein
VSGAAPTGTVQFKDGAFNLGASVALSTAAATLNTNALTTAGSHSITAVYSGDAGNTASTSPAMIESVTQATSTVGVTASAASISVGQSVTFTATVSGGAPTGTVQFTDGVTQLGASVALSGATATLTTTALSAGSHGIAAIYSGDANNLGNTSPAITLTVSAAGSADTGDTDAPTLPQWALLLLGSMLTLTMWRNDARRG